MSNDLSIRIISWNMGESVTHINNWYSELNDWSIIADDNARSYDIIFFTIQEASKKVGKAIGNALRNMLTDYNIYFEGQGTWVPTLHFHVFGYLCIHKDIDVTAEPVENNKKDKTIHSVCIMKNRTCSKSAVAFGVEANGKKLIFVGSHLPVNTKDKVTYGYNLRIDAMKKIQKEVIENVENAIGGADNIFWTGDMNYRILEDGSEQLQNALSEQTLQSYGYIEHNKDDVIETCRYREYSDKEMIEAAKTHELDDETALTKLHTNFVTDRLKGTKGAYDDRRIPSYCDRVIYKGKINVEKYYSWPQPPFDSTYPKGIAYSDHVPIVFEGTIVIPITKPMPTQILIQDGTLGTIGGDSETENDIYLNKYIKYKTKYLQLREYLSFKANM
jgi:Endonuclease/Exonuclease/phosphatase family 2